uniref:uncharacterized protein n=1 Tax=Myxine glutinosa TaxID=7769 RepID=UPI00358F2B9D
MTAKVPASESELSSNDQVVFMEVGETNNAVTQFVGDNIDLNIVSIHGNTPFHSMGWIEVTSPAPPLPDPQTTAAFPRVKLKALDKAKILRGTEVKIIPFTNRKQIGTNAIMFLPLAELSSSLAHDQPLLTPGDTLWAAGWVIKAKIKATKETVIQAGTAIFKYIYHGRDTTLGEIRYNMFSRKAAAGVIKPETLPPTEGAAAQHSLRAYLQTRDWILLQSMSLNPSDYGWTICVHGYEPVPTLDPTAPEELLQFTSCNCHGDCSNRRCSCKKNGVTCISACGVCNGITCRNCSHDVVESEEDIDNDSES